LAGIVTTNVISYTNKAKVRRAYTDAANIEKALTIFKSQYGDYPWQPRERISGAQYTYWEPNYQNFVGDPYLTVNGTPRYLSELLNLNWTVNNATYFCKDCYYKVTLQRSLPGATTYYMFGTVQIYQKVGTTTKHYGNKSILCEGSSNRCITPEARPFRTASY
jgi:hypothetical protein